MRPDSCCPAQPGQQLHPLQIFQVGIIHFLQPAAYIFQTDISQKVIWQQVIPELAAYLSAGICRNKYIRAEAAVRRFCIPCQYLVQLFSLVHSIKPWITSLSMMMCLRGIAYIMTNESSVNVEKVSPAFQMIGRGKILGLPVPGILFLLFVVIGTYGLKYTRFGRSVYATGGNREGARMMGIRIDKTIILSYMLCGIGAAMSGLILASRLGAAQSTAGELYEMQVIAAVVLGGTLLTGGVGHMPGTLFGVFTMSMITNIFNMQGNISTWWQNVIMGFMILAIVIMQSGLEQIKMKKSEEEAIC